MSVEKKNNLLVTNAACKAAIWVSMSFNIYHYFPKFSNSRWEQTSILLPEEQSERRLKGVCTVCHSICIYCNDPKFSNRQF